MINRGRQTGRADDNIDTIKNRLEVYRNQTHPLREYYTTRGSYIPVNGTGTVEEIFDNIATGVENATGERRRTKK